MKLLEPSEYQPAACSVFATVSREISSVLPHARIEHVGASSVPGSASKGDLDICVVVPTHSHTGAVLALEACGYVIKADTLRTPELCMLVSPRKDLDVALQVVAEGSRFEFFMRFRDALRNDPLLVEQYNQLKRDFASSGAERYRAEKARFIEAVLGSAQALSNVNSKMRVVRAVSSVEAECELVLRSLPLWFGQEDSVTQYVRDTSRLPTFVSLEGDAIHGFVTLRQHFQQSFEIHCLAVLAQDRGRGHGRALVEHAAAWAAAQGGRFLQVKTIAEAHPSPEYSQTRAFYDRLGFVPLEVFPTLWSPRHPCLQLVKQIGDAG